MRQVYAAPLGRNVSALGFGCASLGSRVSAARGARAIDQALDLGVTWFDVAPPYGDGMAEAYLGRSLRGRREKVVICTKFGIARPRLSLTQRLLRPLARQAVAVLPGMRSLARRARPTGQAANIDPALIETSVTESLRSLQTDYLDVLALHEPTPQQAADPRIFEVLERLREKGVVRAIGIAGAPASVESAASAGRPIGIAQFPDSPFLNAAPSLRARLPEPSPMFVTHGVFGSFEAVARESPQLHAAWEVVAQRHRFDTGGRLSAVLEAFAFSNNPDGVVITSMFSVAHIKANCVAASRLPISGFSDEIRESHRKCHGLSRAS